MTITSTESQAVDETYPGKRKMGKATPTFDPSKGLSELPAKAPGSRTGRTSPYTSLLQAVADEGNEDQWYEVMVYDQAGTATSAASSLRRDQLGTAKNSNPARIPQVDGARFEFEARDSGEGSALFVKVIQA